LLFVARLAAGEKMDGLVATLTECAQTYRSCWEKGTLAVVLLPTAQKDREAVQIGYGLHGGALRFETLEVSMRPWPEGDEHLRESARLWALRHERGLEEHKELWSRHLERADYIWARYEAPLRSRYPGRWAAISIDGRFVLGADRRDAEGAAEECFGKATALVARLDETRGVPRIGPRSSHA
jgi:hypothetical protein